MRAYGVGGTEPDEDFWRSLRLEDRLEVEDALEIIESLVHVDSSDRDRWRAPLVGGVVITGVKAFRKSVYATGGVIGVPMLSCLITADAHEIGVLMISEGNEAVFGV